MCAAVLHDTAEDQGGKETLAREQRAGVTELTRVVGWAGPLHPLAQRGLSDLVRGASCLQAQRRPCGAEAG